jgi:hypothetical protein
VLHPVDLSADVVQQAYRWAVIAAIYRHYRIKAPDARFRSVVMHAISGEAAR